MGSWRVSERQCGAFNLLFSDNLQTCLDDSTEVEWSRGRKTLSQLLSDLNSSSLRVGDKVSLDTTPALEFIPERIFLLAVAGVCNPADHLCKHDASVIKDLSKLVLPPEQ